MNAKTIVMALLVIAILAVGVGVISEDVGAQQRADRLIRHGQQRQKETTKRRLALVIGNGAYQNASRLTNPTNDAEDMAVTLRELGFELIRGEAQLNLTADQMKQLIVEFGDRLAVSGGTGLFYYAGHGVQSNGRNYLIPVEANILREKTLEFTAVDVNRVLVEMDAAENGFNIVILDACRSNPFTRGWRDGSQGLAQLSAPEGTLIAYATGPGRIAGDGKGRNGTYTAELLKQMRVPGVAIEETFKSTRLHVKTATQGQQIPWEASSLVGDFCFSGNCGDMRTNSSNNGSTLESRPPATDANFELSYWETIKNSNDPEDYRDYLNRYPTGRFTDLARRRISLAISTYVNRRSNFTGELKDRFIPFSFDYPSTWIRDPTAGISDSPIFVKVEKATPDGITLENFAVGHFTGNDTSIMVAQLSQQFAPDNPEFKKVQEEKPGLVPTRDTNSALLVGRDQEKTKSTYGGVA